MGQEWFNMADAQKGQFNGHERVNEGIVRRKACNVWVEEAITSHLYPNMVF